MTVAYVGKNSWFWESGNVSPGTITWASPSAGLKALLIVVTGNDTEGIPTAPAGWSQRSTFSGGGGSWGSGTGPRRITVFEMDALTTGSEGTSTFDVDWVSTGGSAVFGAQIFLFSAATSFEALSIVSGEDTSVGSGAGAFSVTTGTLALQPDDMLMAVAVGSSDSVFQNPAMSASGLTLSATTERETNAANGGNLLCFDVSTATVSSGTATAAVTLALDVLADGISGAAVVIRLREASGGGGGSAIAAISNYYRLMRSA